MQCQHWALFGGTDSTCKKNLMRVNIATQDQDRDHIPSLVEDVDFRPDGGSKLIFHRSDQHNDENLVPKMM